MIKASAPGKVILFGEHSVVYDKLGVAASVDRRNTATVTESDGCVSFNNKYYNTTKSMSEEQLFELLAKVRELKESKDFDGIKILHKSDRLNAPLYVVANVMKKYGFKPMNIVTDGNVTKNLGSGSSAFSAIALAVAKSLGVYPSKKEISDFANEGDIVAHGGTPSGIDSSAVTYGGYIEYKKSMGITPLSINFEVPLIFIDSGQPASTSETVPFIRKQREDHPEFVDKIMDTLNAISALSLDALKSRSLGLLGNLMLEYYVELKKLDISTEKLDEIVDIAMKSGALGAKPTGGWGGGCCIALAKDQAQADMLVKSYRDSGFNSFQAKVGVEGIGVVG